MFYFDGFDSYFAGWSQQFDWTQVFRFYALRGISFNLELKSNLNYVHNPPYEKELANPCNRCQVGDECQKILSDKKTEIGEFTLLNYLTYMFYLPLYFAGPIIPFNSFIYQLNSQIKYKLNFDKLYYFGRCIIVLVGLELYTRICHATALMNNTANFKMWADMEPYEIFMYGWFLLFFIWFKLCLVWKVARCWALFDGIDPEENMGKCLCQLNYSIQHFWRNWHKSFNQWLIRYMYGPLGGNKTKMLNVWVIFIFVALWHELKFQLLMWALSVCLLMVCEIQYVALFSTPFVVF